MVISLFTLYALSFILKAKQQMTTSCQCVLQNYSLNKLLCQRHYSCHLKLLPHPIGGFIGAGKRVNYDFSSTCRYTPQHHTAIQSTPKETNFNSPTNYCLGTLRQSVRNTEYFCSKKRRLLSFWAVLWHVLMLRKAGNRGGTRSL